MNPFDRLRVHPKATKRSRRMKKNRACIIDNREVVSGFYRMSVKSAYLAKNTSPGQFFEVKCPDGSGAFLRRPLGAHKINKYGVEMLYEVAGKGTLALSGMKAGQELDIIGPLGNGFKIGKSNDKYSEAILIAGGIGVAPLVALAENLAKCRKMTVIIGACKKSHVLCESDMKKTGAKVLIATEDGSKGMKGLVTDVLKKLLRPTSSIQRPTIYACGPTGMLKAVAALADKHDIPCQVSMEEHMACGVGVCLGCPVRMQKTGEYKMVCKDGPVFDARGIAW